MAQFEELGHGAIFNYKGLIYIKHHFRYAVCLQSGHETAFSNCDSVNVDEEFEKSIKEYTPRRRYECLNGGDLFYVDSEDERYIRLDHNNYLCTSLKVTDGTTHSFQGYVMVVKICDGSDVDQKLSATVPLDEDQIFM